MKKIYKFYFNEQSYILKENEEERFVIPRDTLEFNGNEFYQNLFKEYSFEDKIEIENMMNEKEIEKDKFAKYILEMLQTMIDDIIKKINEEILFADFKPIKITEEMRKDVLEHPEKYINCPPRIRMGKFYTDEEYERYIEESLNRPLPGYEKKVKNLYLKEKNKGVGPNE